MRPFITLGMATFVMLLALAVTSTQGSIRRLGRRWTQLHRLIYVATATGLFHFWLARKTVVQQFEVVLIAVRIEVLHIVLLERGALDRLGRAEAGLRARAGAEVSELRLNERPQISRSAMMHFEHNGSVAIVFNRHSFSEIVCRGHWVR